MICMANKTAFSGLAPIELALSQAPSSRGGGRWVQMLFDLVFVCGGGTALSSNFFISYSKNFSVFFTCSPTQGFALSYATLASQVA